MLEREPAPRAEPCGTGSEAALFEGQRTGRLLVPLGVLFTATGATALLAEQAFEKLLSTLLGATTPAAATVLAVYFGGFVMGGLVYARVLRFLSDRPLRTYALLEGGIAVWAMFLYLEFDRLIPLFVPLLARGVDRFWLLQVYRLVVAACWILPAAIPMGASFPAIVDVLAQMAVPQHGRMTTRFYACNLLGAIAAASCAPFFIFPRWGLDGGLLLPAVLNLAVCLVALALDYAFSANVAFMPMSDSAHTHDTGSVRSGMHLLIAVAAFSGFVFFALEVIWTQLITTVIGNSVYAFSAMLAMVLVGLGLGSAMASARFPQEDHIPPAEVGMLLLVSALSLASTSTWWQVVPDVLTALGGRLNSFAAAECLRWTVAGTLLVPTSILLGRVYPSLFRLQGFPTTASGAAAGQMVAANAVGSLLGALGTAFGLIPLLGSERSLTILMLLCAGTGLFVHMRFGDRTRRRGLLAITGAILVIVGLQPPWNTLRLTSGKQVYFNPASVHPGTLLEFFHEDTRGGFTTVVRNADERGTEQTLLTNGKFQGNDGGELMAQTAFALVPVMFVPVRDAVLNIGLGTGRTAFTLAMMGFRSIDVAELAPGIVLAARHFEHINGGILDRPGTHLSLEDGRNVLLLRPKRYDLITVEITSVWFAGATNVYSREFYRLARERLTPTGVLQQWIQLHHIGLDEVGSVVATLRSVFPYVSLWTVGGQGLLVASGAPQEIQPAFFASIEKGIDAIGWNAADVPARLADLVASRVLAPVDTDAFVASHEFAANSDRNRRIEYLTPRYNNVHVDFAGQNLRALARFASFPPPRIAGEARGALPDLCRRIGRERYERELGLQARAAADALWTPVT